MGVESTAAAAAGGTTGGGSKPPPILAKSFVFHGVVEAAQERLAAKLDTDQDGGLDLAELNTLGLGSGKNGSAGFAALDSDGDGKLNLRELQRSSIFGPEVLNTLLGQQSGNGLSEWLVTEGDADGDGALTLEEFRTVGPAGDFSALPPADSGLPAMLNKAERAFTAADTDGDGKVTAAELGEISQNYIRRLWPGQNPNALAANLMSRDADGSGGLSATELANEDAAAILETADADRNGELTLAELQAEIARLPEFYASGAIKISGPAVTPLDPSDPRSRARPPVNDFTPIAFEPPTPGQNELLRMFREEMLRLTQAMVGEATKPTSVA